MKGAVKGAVKLASGGHATVWLAKDREGNRVARKCPHPHLLEDPDVRFALHREAEIAMRLHHRNVVQLRGVELVDDAPVLVLDYVEGANLAELVRDWRRSDRPATARAVVRIILDGAAGLHALHELRDERGDPLALVHRDVSPQNVLVGVDGVARISDFGLAKCLATDRATTEGVLKGKAGYLAPEYVRGEAGDRRQDVFSLAVVAWEALAQERLFRGDNDAQTLERILTLPIPSLATARPELNAAPLDAVLARALARHPGDRFATAEEFAEALSTAAKSVGLLGTEDDVRGCFTAERRALLEAHARALALPTRGPPRRRVVVALSLAAMVAAGAGVSFRAYRSTRVSPASAPVSRSAAAPPRAQESTPGEAPALAPAASAQGEPQTRDVAPSPSVDAPKRSAGPRARPVSSSAPLRPRQNPY